MPLSIYKIVYSNQMHIHDLFVFAFSSRNLLIFNEKHLCVIKQTKGGKHK